MTPPLVIPPYLKESPLTMMGMGGGATSSRFYTASSSEAYQIGKSLRFNEDNDPVVKRIPFYSGNRRTWTWAGWVKRADMTSGTSNRQMLWCSGDNSENGSIEFHTDNIFFFHHSGGAFQWSLTTNAKYRDVGAWYHIVVAVDTVHAEEASRCKLYVNGEQVTSFSTANYPSRYYADNPYNEAGEVQILGRYGGGTTYKYDGLYSDVYMIDGMQLTPASFGSFDSTGSFNPKAFSLPAPNAGTTWSSTWSGTPDAGSAAGVFDGTLNNNTYWNTTGERTITTGEFTINNSFRVYGDFNAETVRWKINDTYTPLMANSGSSKWNDIDLSNHTLPITVTSLKYQNVNTSGVGFRSFEVDGVILVDGQTDPTALNNPNDGRVFSDGISGGAWGGYPVTDAFNGALNNGHIPPSGGTSTITFSPAITVDSKVEFYIQLDGSYGDILVNGTAVQSQLKSNSWCPVTGITWPLSTITYSAPSGSDYVTMRAIRVDGHVLLDSSVDNSFLLKFDDASRNSALGKDTLHGKIEDATGGLPIYNTTDDYGDVKGSGNRTDSDSANLKLAIAGDAFTDSSGNSVNVSATNATISQAQSRFYGSSIKFDVSSTNQYLTTGTGLWSANGDATFEAWLWINDFSQDRTIMHTADAASGNSSSDISIQQDRQIRVHPTSANAMDTASVLQAQQWFHLALVQSSTTRKVYINGCEQAMTTVAGNANTAAWNEPAETMYIGEQNDRYFFSGYMNDIRVYDKQKYTTNFKPPARNDFIVSNLNAVDNTLPQGTTATITGWNTGTGQANIHDGDISTVCNGYNGGVVGAVTFSPAIPNVTKVRLYSQPYKHYLNGTDVSSTAGTSEGDPGWYTLYDDSSTPISLTSCGNAYTNGTQSVDLRAIEINGVIQRWGSETAMDSYVDTPTNYGDDTGTGAEVRGNYPTWNPFKTGDTTSFAAGNLNWRTTSNGPDRCVLATMSIPTTGKWYWECYMDEGTATSVGIAPENVNLETAGLNEGYCYYSATGQKYNGNSGASYGDTFTTGDTIGVAYDADNGNLYFYKNGTVQNSGTAAYTGITGTYFPLVGDSGGASQSQVTANFGQRRFEDAAPSGYKALCAQNLSDTFGSNNDTNNPSKYFEARAYTGTGAVGREVEGMNFQPDTVWIKSRSATEAHVLFDAIRGATKRLRPNTQDAEDTMTNTLTAFNSDGFTTNGHDNTNKASDNYISWNWDAGTAAATPSTDGTITPDAQWINATSGFSLIKYTGTAANATIGHGLSSAPDFMILKDYTAGSTDWQAWHSSLNGTQGLQLTTGAAFTQADMWNNTAPTDSVIHLGSGNGTNKSGESIMLYAWTAVEGYSAFGSYTGTGNADGPFVYTGFKPAFIIFKRTDGGPTDWIFLDAGRHPDNANDLAMFPNTNSADATQQDTDFLSNGFKLRNTSGGSNGSSKTYSYSAWAEYPFKTTRAR